MEENNENNEKIMYVNPAVKEHSSKMEEIKAMSRQFRIWGSKFSHLMSSKMEDHFQKIQMEIDQILEYLMTK